MNKYVLIAKLALIGIFVAPSEHAKEVANLITDVSDGKPLGDQNNNQPTEKNFPTYTGGIKSVKDMIINIFGTPPCDQSTNQPTLSNNQSDENCKCVHYYQCRNKTIVDDGIFIIDIKFRLCEDTFHVCCMPSSINRDPGTIVTALPFQQRGCGQRSPEGIGFKITGAQNGESQFGEFPWMVVISSQERISKNGEKNYFYYCGGSLIHPQVVLTAAHCVFDKNASELKIRAGEWDTQTENEILPHQDRDVHSTIIHENFNQGALRNDYALLILKQPVVLADNVDVVCLPDPGAVFDGSRCFASGWGKDIFGGKGIYQVILKRVELPIVNHNECQSQLRQTRLGSHFVLHPSFICAGGELGKDTCEGDGGSPLVCPLRDDPNRFVQAGSVAWGIGCGENGVPGVYSNIAAGRQWIDNKMNSLGFGTASYVY